MYSDTSAPCMSIEIESQLSKTIRILAEVEKIWIRNSLSKDDCLSLHQFQYYALNNQLVKISMTDAESHEIIQSLDQNQNLSIDKQEMITFFECMLNIKKSEPSYEEIKTQIYTSILKIHSRGRPGRAQAQKSDDDDLHRSETQGILDQWLR